MAGDTFRYRTAVEIAGIALILYVLLGPGLYSSGGNDATQQDVPVAKAEIEQLVYPSPGLQCEKHDFNTHIFSTSPLVVWIEDFLSDQEVKHLIELR